VYQNATNCVEIKRRKSVFSFVHAQTDSLPSCSPLPFPSSLPILLWRSPSSELFCVYCKYTCRKIFPSFVYRYKYTRWWTPDEMGEGGDAGIFIKWCNCIQVRDIYIGAQIRETRNTHMNCVEIPRWKAYNIRALLGCDLHSCAQNHLTTSYRHRDR
jgi:hypothetical protein